MSTWTDNTQAAWEVHATDLAKLPGVVAISTGYRIKAGKETREPTVVVTVRRKLSPAELGPAAMVPSKLRLPNGREVGTDVVEDPSAVYTPDQDSAAYRPVPGGCEIGPLGSAFLGTLGGWFCAPEPEGNGWEPVWLTNAHVADPTNFANIPADPRMTQPWAGAVIGNTTAISGWPQPLPGPGTTLNGVTDAAIGVLDDEIDADFQVLQIGPAPFEIDVVTAGMAVQKRGRTTRLANGTVATQPGGGPFLAATVNSPAGGQVWFGLPGQPRLFRVTSPAPGLGSAFGRSGDSGSLVFARAPGQLEGTVPCVGLYFAGNSRWVAAQPNPNALTVTGLAFDIGNVMALLNLDTVCNCVVRSLLDAIFGRDGDNAAERSADRGRAETMMRRFRGRVLEKSRVGKVIAAAIAQTAPDVSRVLAQDPVSFGLAVDLLDPWARSSDSLAVLNRVIDEKTVSTAVELGHRMMKLAPATAERIKPLVELMRESQGQPVIKLIGRYRPGKLPGIGTKPLKSKSQKGRRKK